MEYMRVSLSGKPRGKGSSTLELLDRGAAHLLRVVGEVSTDRPNVHGGKLSVQAQVGAWPRRDRNVGSASPP